MKAKTVTLIVFFAYGSFYSVAQVTTGSASSTRAVRTEPVTATNSTQSDVFSPLKPADGTPYVFSSEADLKVAVLEKREVVLAELKQVQNDPVKVQKFREELWRLDNAIVQPK